jgi:hypothetical protein
VAATRSATVEFLVVRERLGGRRSSLVGNDVRRLILVLLSVGAALVLAACDGNGAKTPAATPPANGTPAVSSPTASASPAPASPAAASPVPDVCPTLDGEVPQTVIARLEVEKDTYELGEPIEMTLRIANCATEPITRTFADEQRYDFSAREVGGVEVWRWSRGMDFAETLGEVTLEPEQEVTFSETWDQVDDEGQQVKAGEYELRGESTGCDEALLNCGPSSARVVEIVAQ